MSGACGQLDLDRRCGAVRLDGLDRGIATRRRSIHLARTDHLVVGGLEVEELLAVRRRLLLVTIVELTVLLDRRDPVLGGRLLVVDFAPQDRLTVAGLERE